MKKLTLRRMDDAHFHPRDDDEITEMVLEHLFVSGFARAVPIFNFKIPIETAWQIDKERKRFQRLGCKIEIVWSIMLTKNTTAQSIREAYAAGARIIKWMPADCFSTNSGIGVRWGEIREKYPCFLEAEKLGMSVKVHLEKSEFDVTGNPTTPPVWREFLPLSEFDVLVRAFPGLVFSIEHISTRRVLRYVLHEAPSNVFGGITAHHLFRTFFDIYDGSHIPKGDEWCMPIYKYPEDREALVLAATGGSDKVHYCSDKAPHRWKDPLSPPAGVYTGLTDICLLAELFEEHDALRELDNFMSASWARSVGLPFNTGTVTLVKEEWTAPEEVNGVRIFFGGKKLKWKVGSIS